MQKNYLKVSAPIIRYEETSTRFRYQSLKQGSEISTEAYVKLSRHLRRPLISLLSAFHVATNVNGNEYEIEREIKTTKN